MNKKIAYFKSSSFVALALAAIFISVPRVSLALVSVSSANTDTSIAREQEQIQFLISNLKKNINVFDGDIYFGMKNENVKNLQIFLSENKFYQGPVTGYYGALTTSAVKKFQKAKNINSTGYFGPKSRNAARKMLEDVLKQICGSGGC